MRIFLAMSCLFAALLTGACQTKDSKPEPEIDLSVTITEAVNSANRPSGDIGRDADRKPQAILEFAGVMPGDRVLDIAAGSGYYTFMLSEIVGDSGTVYAVNPQIIADKYSEGIKPLTDAVAAGLLPNVEYSLTPSFAENLPENIDVAMNILFYHDFVWHEKDRAAANKAVFDALKPGGLYIVVDHSSIANGWEVAESLHRGNERLTKEEIQAAGFELVDESDVLRHPEDPLTGNVFSEIRGKTDRFVLKFRKPKA